MDERRMEGGRQAGERKDREERETFRETERASEFKIYF